MTMTAARITSLRDWSHKALYDECRMPQHFRGHVIVMFWSGNLPNWNIPFCYILSSYMLLTILNGTSKQQTIGQAEFGSMKAKLEELQTLLEQPGDRTNAATLWQWKPLSHHFVTVTPNIHCLWVYHHFPWVIKRPNWTSPNHEVYHL